MNLRNLIIWLAIVVLFSGLSGHQRVLAQETVVDPGLAGLTRSELVIPADLWTDVRSKIGYSDRPLGYSADEMANFGIGTDCILGSVEILFRDINSIPQLSGRLGDTLLASPANFASSGFNLYRFLDAYGGRVMEYALPTGWEADWIPEGAGVDEGFQAVLDRGLDEGIMHPMYDDDRAQWEMLPDEVRLLVTRVIMASIETAPWLKESINEEFYCRYFGVEDVDEISIEQLYEFASWPWQEESPNPSPRESFEALHEFDIKFFATGSNEFSRMTWGAIEEYRTAIADNQLTYGGFDYCEFMTEMGKVGVFGTGPDMIDGEYFLIVDLGGGDDYSGKTAVPLSLSQPFGIVIDLGGDDDYFATEPASLACGNHGIGAIFDLSGDDEYVCHESGIGCAWYGTGMVIDYSGNDKYSGYQWTQGAAHAGVGILTDLEGDDYYDTVHESQGFGSTFGVGAILDVSGNDIYFADPEGDLDEVFEFRTVNFAQGTGFGRRADFGDGHSLGGGIGMLVEGDGDDTYTGSVYSQGAGYWWALGFLEDRGGNDTYYNEQYSCGSAPHFAIGCLVDFTGDDRYNVGYEDVERQIQGHARDGSMAVFIDGSGNDDYFLPNMAAGSSDLNCLTLFWDRMGDDHYVADRNPPRGTAFSFGDSTRYSVFNTFRDTMASTGVFLDTGGFDSYEERDSDNTDDVEALIRIPFGDNMEWIQRDEHPNYGYGIDTGWFTGFVQPVGPVEE